MATETEALADLKVKVSTMLDDMKIDAINRIDNLERAGTAISADHALNSCNWVTAKIFILAYAKQIECDYAFPTKNAIRARTINNYYRTM